MLFAALLLLGDQAQKKRPEQPGREIFLCLASKLVSAAHKIERKI